MVLLFNFSVFTLHTRVSLYHLNSGFILFKENEDLNARTRVSYIQLPKNINFHIYSAWLKKKTHEKGQTVPNEIS